MKAAGFDGTISIELEFAPDPDKIVDWVTEAYRETDKLMQARGLRNSYRSTSAPIEIASQYATRSHTEKNRPSNRTPPAYGKFVQPGRVVEFRELDRCSNGRRQQWRNPLNAP